jgi:hypothetical protein
VRAEIEELREHVQNIILVGPPAEFTEDVYKLIARRDPDDDMVSLSQKYLNRATLVLNQSMAEFARTNGVRYVDRIALFCNAPNACELVSDQGDIYIWDYGHLLPAGARLLGERLSSLGVFSHPTPPNVP